MLILRCCCLCNLVSDVQYLVAGGLQESGTNLDVILNSLALLFLLEVNNYLQVRATDLSQHWNVELRPSTTKFLERAHNRFTSAAFVVFTGPGVILMLTYMTSVWQSSYHGGRPTVPHPSILFRPVANPIRILNSEYAPVDGAAQVVFGLFFAGLCLCIVFALWSAGFKSVQFFLQSIGRRKLQIAGGIVTTLGLIFVAVGISLIVQADEFIFLFSVGGCILFFMGIYICCCSFQCCTSACDAYCNGGSSEPQAEEAKRSQPSQEPEDVLGLSADEFELLVAAVTSRLQSHQPPALIHVDPHEGLYAQQSSQDAGYDNFQPRVMQGRPSPAFAQPNSMYAYDELVYADTARGRFSHGSHAGNW